MSKSKKISSKTTDLQESLSGVNKKTKVYRYEDSDDSCDDKIHTNMSQFHKHMKKNAEIARKQMLNHVSLDVRMKPYMTKPRGYKQSDSVKETLSTIKADKLKNRPKGKKGKPSKVLYEGKDWYTPMPSDLIGEMQKLMQESGLRTDEKMIEAIIHDDPQVLKEVFHMDSPEEYLPQLLINTRARPLNNDRLRAACWADPLLAVQKGIHIGKTVTTASGEIGFHILCAAAYEYLAHQAAKGEWPTALQIPEFTNRFFQALSPKQIQHYEYSFTNIPDWTTSGTAYPLICPFTTNVSLAWPVVGAFTPDGQQVLVNTPPNITEDDILDHGIPALQELWRTLRSKFAGKWNFVNFRNTDTTWSAAAYTLPVPGQVEDDEAWLLAMSEVPVQGHHLWLSSLALVDFADPSVSDIRCTETYSIREGLTIFLYLNMKQESRPVHLVPCLAQIPYVQYEEQMVEMLCAADFFFNEIKNTNQQLPVQDINHSVVYQYDPAALAEYMAVVLCEKMSIDNYLFYASKLYNEDVYHHLGVGMYYVNNLMETVDCALPMAITENLAASSYKLFKIGAGHNGFGYWQLVIPVLVGKQKTFGSPLENGLLGNPFSATQSMRNMYPNLDPAFSWSFGPSIRSPVFDWIPGDAAIFLGNDVVSRILQVQTLMSANQSYFEIGAVLGNIHDHPFTVADYALCTTVPVDDGSDLDYTLLTDIQEFRAYYPFDSNHMSDQISRCLPIVCSDTGFKTYTDFAKMHCSLFYTGFFHKHVSKISTLWVHDRYESSAWEAGMAQRVATYRGMGGGIMDFLGRIGKVAIPLAGRAANALLSKFLPGMGLGGIVQDLSDDIAGMLHADHSSPQTAKLLDKGWKNPGAAWARPYTARSQGSTSKVTRRDKFKLV